MIAIACHAEPTTSTPAPARVDTPAPRSATPSSAASDSTAVSDASIEAMNADAITCVLADRRVAQYLHAELPGRVPVKLHLASTIAVAKTPEAAGAPVELVDASAALVDVQSIARAGTSATVELTILREGVRAKVECHRDGEAWTVGKAEVAEH
ncbi:MAG TPA: hypothetical protein VG755_26725 [Nannocystaceae bacterium]|nr:hypothetical protein [Nannocystaceae bacterium]